MFIYFHLLFTIYIAKHTRWDWTETIPKKQRTTLSPSCSRTRGQSREWIDCVERWSNTKTIMIGSAYLYKIIIYVNCGWSKQSWWPSLFIKISMKLKAVNKRTNRKKIRLKRDSNQWTRYTSTAEFFRVYLRMHLGSYSYLSWSKTASKVHSRDFKRQRRQPSKIEPVEVCTVKVW